VKRCWWRRVGGIGLGLCLIAGWGSASWLDLERADAALDLAAARGVALEMIAGDPCSPEAVAAASWWLGNLDSLAEPEVILSAATGPLDPELGFVLRAIEAELGGTLSEGVAPRFEIAGPFGFFSTLDIERSVVPADAELPALGTPWQGPARPFRLELASQDGFAAPPEPMETSGVYLAGWSFLADREVTGWLVLEAHGGVNLSFDGTAVDVLRRCGEGNPSIVWYRIDLRAGAHRLRAEIAARQRPRARVSLLDDRGMPLGGLHFGSPSNGPWAGGEIRRAVPPAAAQVFGLADAEDAPVSAVLVAAALARLRGNVTRQRQWLLDAARKAPEDPVVQLALARFFLTQPTGADVDEDYRRCRDLGLARLLERALAVRENRVEDVERLVDQLIEAYPDDPRVLRLWIREAVRRGWAREAEESLDTLQTLLPGSHEVAELRLAVLGAIERWRERNELLVGLAERDDIPPAVIDELRGGCFRDQAIAALRRLQAKADDPLVDAQLVQELINAGRHKEAGAELEKARTRWGAYPELDELALMVALETGRGVDEALASALSRLPSDTQLRTLAWRRGAKPFWDKYRVDYRDFVSTEKDQMEGVDSVLLLDQAVERVYEDGSSLYYYHGLSRALTPEGARQAAALQEMPDATLLSVRIIKPDGRIEVPAEPAGQDGSITLKGVEPGDLVEEEYVAEVAAAGPTRPAHLSPYTYRFADSTRAFGLSEYVLLVPPRIDLGTDGNFTGLEHSDSIDGGLRVIRWRAESVPPIPDEPFSPPTQELLPWVSYGFGVTWGDVGDLFRDRALSVLVSSPELAEWEGAALASSDPQGALRRLVERVLAEVDFGRGVLDLGSTAGESFSRRRGNRLAILATVLCDTGWDVDLVLGRPRPYAGTHLEVPSLEAFYVPVLRVARDAHEIWIDIEEEKRGVDHLSPILQGSDALVLPLSDPRKPSYYLEQLPVFANPDLEEELHLEAAVDGGGNARVVLAMPLRGGQGLQMLENLRAAPEDRVRTMFAQLAGSLFPGAERVEGSIEEGDDEVVLRLALELPRACELEQGRLICRSLVVARPLAPSLASLPERRFPLVLALPASQRITTLVEAPPGWAIERPPRLLETPWGSVTETLEGGAAGFSSVLELTVPAQTVEPTDYPQFARFCHAVDELVLRPPVLTQTNR
jgi:hypothetical protein